MTTARTLSDIRWFAMRDLKRHNAKDPAYKMLAGLEFEVFTPLTKRLSIKGGKRVWKEVPVIQDLLFVHETRSRLDPVVEKTPTLQYRFLRNTFREPMTVRDDDMERFIKAIGATESPKFYQPGEITSEMCGSRVRIIGGPLDGCEGPLLSTRGSKYKKLIVELPNFIAASVEIVEADLIEVLNE